MFKLLKQQVGPWHLMTLKNAFTGSEFTVAPSRGACLTHLALMGESILDGYQSREDLEHLKGTKSGLLFPFPNRLKEGKYQWENVDYQFPINEPQLGNAIHGLGLEMPFKLQHIDIFPNRARVVLASDFSGSSAFPFPFRKEVRYELDGNRFRVFWKVINRGSTAMPFAWGWHPYFQLGGKVDEWNLKLPECKQVIVDEKMIPTGEFVNFQNFQKLSPIGKTVFDTCFELPHRDKIVMLEGPSGRIQMTLGRLQTFFQIFIPPSRESIALEPMTSNINSLQNGNGLLSVPVHGSKEDHCEITFE